MNQESKSKSKPYRARQRTNLQSRALHLWYELKTTQCREAGVTVQKVFKETIELEMTPKMMKEIWRMVQKAMYDKSSTKQLAKIGEIEEVAEHLNRFFAEKFNLPGLEIPSDPDYIPGAVEQTPYLDQL